MFAVITAFVLGTANIATAQKRNDREVRDAARSLASKVDDLDYTLNYQLKSNSASRDTVGEVSNDILVLKNSLRDFQGNFDLKRENKSDVERVVEAARSLDAFLRTNPQNRHIGEIGNGIRKDVERLGSSYGVTPSWDADPEPRGVKDYPESLPGTTITVGLTGTYTLDTQKSEAFEDAIGNIKLTSDQRDDLKEKLEAPGQIAIDIRGNQVTLATTSASPVTITADGRETKDQSGSGAQIRRKATLNGQALTLSSFGGETDYTVTLSSEDGGRLLKVSRRITTDYLAQTVFSESVYNRTDSVAGLGINPGTNAGNDNRGGTASDQNGGYSDNDQNVTPSNGGNYPNNRGNGGNNRNNGNGGNPNYGGLPSVTTNRTGDFVVPNGVVISGTLENEINTAISQNNDRFRMTVQSPDEFKGSTIEGYVTGVARSGRVAGRSNITFNFEKITLTNGKTYDFAGYLQAVTDGNGKVIKVDPEGSVKGDNQTRQTATRSGIGAGIGALIGVIAGGGQGAAIGAIIGGGAGAGSVVAQGRDDLQLHKGSNITVQSSSPIKPAAPPDK